ncbi:hypothetical protein PGT21_004851 [Puccinia graminis f. sp. tritici]|uniref:Uncharacterized protein n=1 Tax=Puccinia graminis f. sp. tritici TaxID=56615 RepID=A0A5B0N3B2_PUCGR|nr:hypothetical protein PGT21_004851 [Puccinia graminis f. sp. tritici]
MIKTFDMYCFYAFLPIGKLYNIYSIPKDWQFSQFRLFLEEFLEERKKRFFLYSALRELLLMKFVDSNVHLDTSSILQFLDSEFFETLEIYLENKSTPETLEQTQNKTLYYQEIEKLIQNLIQKFQDPNQYSILRIVSFFILEFIGKHYGYEIAPGLKEEMDLVSSSFLFYQEMANIDNHFARSKYFMLVSQKLKQQTYADENQKKKIIEELILKELLGVSSYANILLSKNQHLFTSNYLKENWLQIHKLNIHIAICVQNSIKMEIYKLSHISCFA